MNGLTKESAEEISAHATANYAAKIGRIAWQLQKLAEDVERQATPQRYDSNPVSMSSACAEVTSTILSLLPNLGLASLAGYAAEADYFYGFAQGASETEA